MGEDYEDEAPRHAGELPVKIVQRWDRQYEPVEGWIEAFDFHYADGDVQEGWLLPRAWAHLLVRENRRVAG